MTKAELVKAIAAQTGIEAVTVATVVEQMMEEIRQSMIGGENVYLRGFGSFILKHRAQKVARNIAKNRSRSPHTTFRLSSRRRSSWTK